MNETPLLSLEHPSFAPLVGEIMNKEKPQEDDIFSAMDGDASGADESKCLEETQVWSRSFICNYCNCTAEQSSYYKSQITNPLFRALARAAHLLQLQTSNK